MKNLFAIGLAVILLPFYSPTKATTLKSKTQEIVTQERKTSDYESIDISGSFKVNLIKGNEGNIQLKGEKNVLDQVVVEVKSNELNIHFKKSSILNYKTKVEIFIPVESINKVELSGSGSITSDTTLKSSNFSATQNGSGHINLSVESTNLKLEVAGSGHINVNGKTESLRSDLTGSGHINSEDLVSTNAEVEISGSGHIKLQVQKKLEASITGSGNIGYKGNPENVNESVTGSGKIYKI